MQLPKNKVQSSKFKVQNYNSKLKVVSSSFFLIFNFSLFTFNSRRRQAGFTLIELLIVIALMGILSGFSIIQTMTYQKKQVLQDAAEQLVADLKMAQSKAASGVQDDPGGQSIKAFFVRNTVGNTYTLNRSLTASDNQISSQTLKSPVTIALWPGDIIFRVPTGNLQSATSQTIQVCYTNVGYHDITIEPSGRIYKSKRLGSTCP